MEEFKLTAIKVIGLGEIGKEITSRVTAANFEGVETKFIDQDKTTSESESSWYEDLLDGVEMLILIFEPHKPDDVIYSILKTAKDKNILVVGLTLRYYLYNLDEELLFRDLINRGVDSVFSVFVDESNHDDKNAKAWASRSSAEDKLYDAVEGLVSLINVPQYIYLTFEDIYDALSQKGHIYMGKGHGEGEDKALSAVKKALETTPVILNNFTATKFTFLITGNISLTDASDVSEYLRGLSEAEKDILFAASSDGDEEETDLCNVFLIASDYKAPEKSKPEKVMELNVPDFLKGKNYDNYVSHRSPKRFLGSDDDFEFEFIELDESDSPEI